jgi:hypothetical protein
MNIDKPARPWDLFNKNIEKLGEEISSQRMEICKTCPFLTAGLCKKCGCIMSAKTKLPHAKCPIGKWDKYKGDLLQ